MEMRKILLILTIFFATLPTAMAQQYTREDSLRVMELFAEAARQKPNTNWMLFFARKFRGVPYVAKTLEINAEEQLIVNLRQLDCTTLVETALALTLCMKNKATTFADYCRYLRLVRYRDGIVSYPDRLHYFTDWIDDNTRLGFVREVALPRTIPTVRQTLSIDYMSTHVEQYPMLLAQPEWVEIIRKSEKKLTGQTHFYIPKNQISNNAHFRQAIHDGDILAITTSKRGLDTSHIGIAVWKKDGLHLLNASMIRKKVVEEPMTLRQYMQKQKSQTGIRVIRVR